MNELTKTETGWTLRCANITDLMNQAVAQHMACRTPDAVLNIETHLFNVTLCADSCTYDVDLGKDIWLNIGRWSRLIKEYVPKAALDRFVAQAIEIWSGEARDGATANMFFRDPDRYAKKHRWGGCLMGATFRGNGTKKSGQPTITMYSRTTYMGYMALLDAGIGHVLAQTIVKGLQGVGVEDVAFRWHISSQQLHCFKTLPYVYSKPDLLKQLNHYRVNIDRENDPPTYYHMAKWYDKVIRGYRQAIANGLTPEQWLLTEKYGPFRRIKRRWLEYKGHLTKNLPASCPISTLTFTKAE